MMTGSVALVALALVAPVMGYHVNPVPSVANPLGGATAVTAGDFFTGTSLLTTCETLDPNLVGISPEADDRNAGGVGVPYGQGGLCTTGENDVTGLLPPGATTCARAYLYATTYAAGSTVATGDNDCATSVVADDLMRLDGAAPAGTPTTADCLYEDNDADGEITDGDTLAFGTCTATIDGDADIGTAYTGSDVVGVTNGAYYLDDGDNAVDAGDDPEGSATTVDCDGMNMDDDPNCGNTYDAMYEWVDEAGSGFDLADDSVFDDNGDDCETGVTVGDERIAGAHADDGFGATGGDDPVDASAEMCGTVSDPEGLESGAGDFYADVDADDAISSGDFRYTSTNVGASLTGSEFARLDVCSALTLSRGTSGVGADHNYAQTGSNDCADGVDSGNPFATGSTADHAYAVTAGAFLCEVLGVGALGNQALYYNRLYLYWSYDGDGAYTPGDPAGTNPTSDSAVTTDNRDYWHGHVAVFIDTASSTALASASGSVEVTGGFTSGAIANKLPCGSSPLASPAGGGAGAVVVGDY